MYVGSFRAIGPAVPGREQNQSAASAANVLDRAADELAEIHMKGVGDFQQDLQARRATVILKKAHARLGKAGINRKLRHGGLLTLPLIGKQFGDSAADIFVVIVLWHDLPVAKKGR
jgi:hypothetical protein